MWAQFRVMPRSATRLMDRSFPVIRVCLGFDLDRRAYDRGTASPLSRGNLAFVERIVKNRGAVSKDTMAEDTDLTLTMHRQGYKVASTPTDMAFTGAPRRQCRTRAPANPLGLSHAAMSLKHRDMSLTRFMAPGLFQFAECVVLSHFSCGADPAD